MTKHSTRDWQGIGKAIANGAAFTTHGALSGANVNGHMTAWDLGRLPDEYSASALFATYIVSSYATPIAWRCADGSWALPNVKYSVTTTKHQSVVATALAQHVTPEVSDGAAMAA